MGIRLFGRSHAAQTQAIQRNEHYNKFSPDKIWSECHPGRLYGVNNLKNRIIEITEDLNLKSFLNKKTGELSSGQKNRVSLAKSIINDPSVLLLDEPTASLDPETGDFVRSFLEEYQKEKKTSILLASHNMAEVERLCSSVLMMNKGSIIDQGTPGELIKKHGRRNMEEVFLKLTRDLIWI